MDSSTETTDQATLFTVLAGRRHRDVDVAGREVKGRIKLQRDYGGTRVKPSSIVTASICCTHHV